MLHVLGSLCKIMWQKPQTLKIESVTVKVILPFIIREKVFGKDSDIGQTVAPSKSSVYLCLGIDSFIFSTGEDSNTA